MHRVCQFDREIRAVGNDDAGVEELAPGVCALDSFRAHAVFSHVHIAGCVSRLHRCNDAELCEAGNILESYDLYVFDTIAQLRGLATLSLVKGIKCHLVAEIANCMNSDLESHVVRFPDKSVQLFLRPVRQASVLDIIVIGFEHCGATAAERPVDHELDSRNYQVVVAIGRNRFANGVEIFASPHHHGVNTHVHLLVIRHRHIGFGFRDIDPGIVHAGQAKRGQLSERCQKRLPVVFLCRRRDLAENQIHRLVDQRARRMPVGITDNLAAERIRRVVINAGDRQRFAVRPAGVAVNTPQPYRAVGNDGIDAGCRRELLYRPEHLVPAAALDPGGARIRFVVGSNTFNCVFDARRPGEVQLYIQESLIRNMRVRINKSGQHEPAAAVDLPGVRVPGEQLVRTRGDDAALVVKNQNTELPDVAIGRGCIAGHRMQQRIGSRRSTKAREACKINNGS